jgi:yeast amino acid transporter
VGFVGASIITLITGYPVFLDGRWNASTFVASYIGIPIFIVPIIVWKLIYRTKVGVALAFSFFFQSANSQKSQFARASSIDIWSGRLQPGEIEDESKPPTTLWGRFIDWIF